MRKEYKNYKRQEWPSIGKKLYGENLEDWKFRCPRCKNIASGGDFKILGVKNPNTIYRECIGRHRLDRGCDYASYGLIDICTAHVDGEAVFEFADKVD